MSQAVNRHNQFVLSNPFGSYYQTTWFAETKKELGFTRYVFRDLEDESGQIESSFLAWLKPVPKTPFTYAFLRAGFTLDYDRPDWQAVLDRLWKTFLEVCRQNKVIYLRFDLNVPDTRTDVYEWFREQGVNRKSPEPGTKHTFFRYRALLDISGSLDDFMARLPKKMRSQINRTDKFGFSFEETDLSSFDDYYEIRRQTAERDHFSLENKEKLRKEYEILLNSPIAKMYNVRLDGKETLAIQEELKAGFDERLATLRSRPNPKQNQIDELEMQVSKIEERITEMQEIAAAHPDGILLSTCVVFTGGHLAEYYHAASSNSYRDYLPNYFMIKNIVRVAQESGAEVLDMGGTGPDSIEHSLTEFKKYWGTETIGLSGDMEYIVNSFFGGLFKRVLEKREADRQSGV